MLSDTERSNMHKVIVIVDGNVEADGVMSFRYKKEMLDFVIDKILLNDTMNMVVEDYSEGHEMCYGSKKKDGRATMP